MMQETIELIDKFPFVISDRTTLDCVVYEQASTEVKTGIKKDLTKKAKNLLDISLDFLSVTEANIYYVEKGYDFVLDEHRSSHSIFIERSSYWFDIVYRYTNAERVDLRDANLLHTICNSHCNSDNII